MATQAATALTPTSTIDTRSTVDRVDGRRCADITAFCRTEAVAADDAN